MPIGQYLPSLLLRIAAAILLVGPAQSAPADNSVQAPLEVRIDAFEPRSGSASRYTIRIHLAAPSVEAGADRIHVTLAASGIVHLSGPRVWTVGRDDAVRGLDLLSRAYLAGPGEGSLRVEAQERDAAGSPLWGSADDLFVLRTARELLTGKSSLLELQREKLRRDLAAGRISPDEYRRQTQKLLTGGKPDPAAD
ncbi:MAG: hypothetical protein P4L83_15350 [Nevskia sp.]|nr:hypothetical protein [Nevskia sp.]